MKYLAFLIIPLMFFFIGCDEETTVIQNPDTGELLLVINGLEDLGSTAEYEGWLIVNGNPVTTGKFSVDASGNLSQTMFDVDQSDLDNASTFVLTIEPKPDPDPARLFLQRQGHSDRGRDVAGNHQYQALIRRLIANSEKQVSQ